MYITINKALSRSDVSLTRGECPEGYEEWQVTGISDDTITLKGRSGEKIIIEVKQPEESLKQLFRAIMVTTDKCRNEIDTSHSFKTIWNEVTDTMEEHCH